MNELSNSHHTKAAAGSVARPRDWGKAMSDHVAFALLVYTSLQIFLTVKAMTAGFSSILPYLALVVLVAAIIPACRSFEKRWTRRSEAERADESLAGEFRRDTIYLWAMAILLPVALTGIFKLIL